MNLSQACALAQEIAQDRCFRVNEMFLGQYGYLLKITIVYSHSRHYVSDRRDWEWVVRNLARHPQHGGTRVA